MASITELSPSELEEGFQANLSYLLRPGFRRARSLIFFPLPLATIDAISHALVFPLRCRKYRFSVNGMRLWTRRQSSPDRPDLGEGRAQRIVESMLPPLNIRNRTRFRPGLLTSNALRIRQGSHYLIPTSAFISVWVPTPGTPSRYLFLFPHDLFMGQRPHKIDW